MRSGAVTKTLKGHLMKGVFDLALCPNGQYLATNSSDRVVRVWRLSTRDVALSIFRNDPYNPYNKDHWQYYSSGNFPNYAAFSPDGQILAVGDGKVIRRWDLAAGEEIEPIHVDSSGKKLSVHGVSFSPDGQFLAARYKYQYSGDSNTAAFRVGTGSESSSVLIRELPEGSLLGFISNTTFDVWTGDGQTQIFWVDDARQCITIGNAGSRHVQDSEPARREVGCILRSRDY
jgi:WD40 repeat protein